jgi:deoxyadenosine/deoxycytidine kinase
MDHAYMEAVNRAYQEFFARYGEGGVLAIDTNPIDFVRNSADLKWIVQQVRTALETRPYQPPLLG